MKIRFVYRPSYRRVQVAELRSEFACAGARAKSASASATSSTTSARPRIVVESEPEPQQKKSQAHEHDAFEETDSTVLRPSRGLRTARLFVLALMRLATIGVAMAAWCIASVLGLSVHFPFDAGLFSHWQVWFAASLFLYAGSALLARHLQSAARRQRIAMSHAATRAA